MNDLKPQEWKGLLGKSCFEAMAIALNELEVLGVKLQVNEVEKLNFQVHFMK